MKNFKLTIEYDGSRYCGWQAQKTHAQARGRKHSIQETIERCLGKILGEKIALVASGRTDSGVHALGQVAHFKSATRLPPQKIKAALNAVLPRDIRVAAVEGVASGFHARYAAVTKVYHYYIQQQAYPSAFFKNYSYWYKFPLNIRAMKQASRRLVGKHDFRAFCASGGEVKDATRTIQHIAISKANILSCRMICIEIEADGFLHNMVRNIVGTLIDVGRGRFAPRSITTILKKKQRALAGPCVPAKGLFLVRVYY